MVDAALPTARRDGEVDARIVEHPFGVVVLVYRGLGGEQRRIKPDAGGEIGHRDMDMKSFHAALLFGRTVGLGIVCTRCAAASGAQSEAQAPGPSPTSAQTRQQFSLR